jgi:proline iminopeptidase
MSKALRQLYPEIEPFRHGMLPVSAVHSLYWEQCGNPTGKPVVILHGGPGGGCTPKYRRFHDPAKYCITLFDQRGAGRSTPHASLENNTTWDLVADIEKLRAHLNVEKWQVFGGSWGSTLAVAYAEKHPQFVMELVMRGLFMLRRGELEFFYQDGASRVFPEAWAPYRDYIPVEERGDFMAAYLKRLTSEDPAVRLEAAKIWSIWEGSTCHHQPDPNAATDFGDPHFALAFARIENHYFINKGFFEVDDQLLRDAAPLRNIPGVLVHGRYDMVCPVDSAWDMKQVWPELDVRIMPNSGHSAFEPEIMHELLEATDKFAASA